MTSGMQHQPKALHSSIDKVAAQAENPATNTITIFGFSGNITEILKAAVLPRAQLGSKMSAGCEWS